ncbi:MAG: prepilin-type N-terminal cleavage/methylation domain-containing protein [Proteobacteria bacterium]|nr:prepilin-type N-terminal cleavage/methylation domain-containing protein [Pseudomonadota bacterium]MBU1716269.1 prepilin-type N-terminal cleavage/methylation domain-containing protein [Pseudomonadota bacterium]
MKKDTPPNSAGFTLTELIIVIVILGILGVMGADFISQAFKGFKDTDNRSEIYEEGKMALVRMELEIHNAIPNAVNLPLTTELQFGMIDEVAMRNIFGTYNENPPTTLLTDLLVLPPTSDPTAFLPVNSIISVYNRNWGDFTSAPIRLYKVDAVALGTMTISSNIPPPRSSPLKRYYAVDRAIRYQLSGNILARAEAPVTTAGVGAYGPDYPLAQNISGLTFAYAPASLTRNGVVTIIFTITRGVESVNFHKEVHIRNVP